MGVLSRPVGRRRLVKALVLGVVGIGCQEPGSAPDLNGLWNDLKLGGHLLHGEESFLTEPVITRLQAVVSPDVGHAAQVERKFGAGAASLGVEDLGGLLLGVVFQQLVEAAHYVGGGATKIGSGERERKGEGPGGPAPYPPPPLPRRLCPQCAAEAPGHRSGPTRTTPSGFSSTALLSPSR